MYAIKPLKWRRSPSYEKEFQSWTTRTTFGVFQVRRMRDEDGKWEPWQWSYCFGEYYDEDSGECETAKEGKEHLERLWEKRMLECLEEV